MKIKRLKHILRSNLEVPAEVDLRVSETLASLGAKLPQTEKHSAITYKMKRPIRLAAAIAAILLTMAITAVAVAHYFGSFDRLREIVGDERADTLQPMGSSRVVGGFITDDSFSVELVAVGVMANVVDLYITLEDLSGRNRLEGDISASFRLHPADNPETSSSIQFSEIINRTNDGVVTLHRRHAFLDSLSEQALAFRLDGILHNFRTGELAIDIDLSTLTEQTPAAWLWDTPILPPGLHDIDLSLPGFEKAGRTSLSSIGIIDGRLHIQEQYDQAALYRWTKNTIRLIDPQGEIVWPLRGTEDNTATVSFGIDEDGKIYNDRGYNFATFYNRENIFEVDLERLSEYRLVAVYDVYDHTPLSWIVIFEVEVPDEGMELLVADGLELYLAQYSTTIREIRISPFSVMIRGYQTLLPDGVVGLGSGDVRIHTDDGEVFEVNGGWVRIDTLTRELDKVMDIATDSLDLDTVVSIEIAGEIIEFR